MVLLKKLYVKLVIALAATLLVVSPVCAATKAPTCYQEQVDGALWVVQTSGATGVAVVYADNQYKTTIYQRNQRMFITSNTSALVQVYAHKQLIC